MGQQFIGITDALLCPLYALFSAYNTVLEISITISVSQKRKLRSVTYVAVVRWDKEERHYM